MEKENKNTRVVSILRLLLNICFGWLKSGFEHLSYQLKWVKEYDANSQENENLSKTTVSEKYIENANLYIPEDIYGVML